MKLSELAQRILVSNERERQSAMKEMVFNYPLWKDIYEKFGSNPSDFRIALQKVTGVNSLAADAEKEVISNLYIDAVSNISNEKSNEISEDMNQQSAIQQQDIGAKFDAGKETLTFYAEGISLKITNDPDHLEKAGAFINLFLAQPSNKAKKKESEQTKS